MTRNSKEHLAAAQEEADKFYEIELSVEKRNGGHNAVVIKCRHHTRFVIFAETGSDKRGILNFRRDVRKECMNISIPKR
jgi:hypothetical protein